MTPNRPRRGRPAAARLVPTLVLGTLLIPALVAAQGDPPADPATERVARLCEAWTAAKYLHPGLAHQETDWDAAFVTAAPKAWAAADTPEYRAVAEEMLAVLGDPATELVAAEGAETPFEPGEPPALFVWPRDEVLLVDLARFQRIAGPYALYPALLQGLPPELEKARAVIFDLRIPPETSASQDWSDEILSYVAGALVPREVQGASERWLVHWGFRPQEGSSSGGYRSAFATSLAQVHTPDGEDPVRRPVVFLVNERTQVPDVALALQGAGEGRIVSVGPLTDRRMVERIGVDLGEGLEARVVASELLPPGGALRADVEVPGATADSDPGLDAALALLDEPWRPGAAEAPTGEPAAARPPGTWRPDRRYPEMIEPDLGHRLLAGCRTWGTIRHFYPYLHLLDDWDGAFRRSLPELAAAEDGETYVRAVLRLVAHVEDGHTNVWGHPGLRAVRGEALVPIRIREIEGRMVVTRVHDPAVEGLHVGDEIHAVDGRPIEEGIEAMWPLVTASRPAIRRLVAARWSLGGPADSAAVLTVSGADGVRREVEVVRGRGAAPEPEPEAEPWRILEETGELEVGYVDLTELQVPQVDRAMAALAGTDAIVFDMRGYPHGTAWLLAPRLNVTGATQWASFRRREVSYQSFDAEESGYFFVQRIPEADVEPYRGRVVMLIDERAISQAEHTALAFEQVADAVFVGTPTAGANGDATNFFLPGGVRIFFTGHDVRHADGRQLQRVGILPDVEVAPTLAGFRAGRDEVLERALELLRQEAEGAIGAGR